MFLSLASLTLHAALSKDQALKQENQKILDISERMTHFYDLKNNEDIKDITEQVLESPDTKPDVKEEIKAYHRRIYLFRYPSDGLSIKGFVSLPAGPACHPLLVLFRWGNRNFALFNPGLDMANYRDYAVISSTLRGGVSEGQDEFGGTDIDDMKNLIAFYPQLANKLHACPRPTHLYMLGPSRGGLEMFLMLARYPQLQNKVEKIVALSSILDLHRQITDREDMKTMFMHDFGLSADNAETWIKQRDPLETVPYLRKSLPILIIQGTKDQRVDLEEGHHMVEKLQEHGNPVTYWELEGGNHTLRNIPHLMDDIGHWLESPLPHSPPDHAR